MLSGVIGASVGYGILLGFLLLSGCASLLAYWLHRRHPVLSKRMPWLTLLSSAFGVLLSLVLVVHLFLPYLPSLSSNSLPCTLLYVASHLYCGLVLLPYILRTIRLLSLYSPTSTDDSRRGKQLAPLFYPLSLALTVVLLCVGGGLWYAFGGHGQQSEVRNESGEQCLLFDEWQYFVPLCGCFFLVWSWLLLRLGESQREDPYLLCFEQSACWLSVALLLVSYFVLLTLPSGGDLESSFPIEWLVVGLDFCLQALSVWMPLYQVWQFNRHQRNNAASDSSQEEEHASPAVSAASSGQKRHLGKTVELIKKATAGEDGPIALTTDDSDELNKSATLDGLPAHSSSTALAKMAGAVSGGAVDITNVWSIDRILSDPMANVLLEQHAQRFLCSELVLCWNDIQKHNGTPWRLDSATDLDAAFASGLSIYSTYIKAGSLYEVNVDSKIRAALAAVFDKPHTQQEKRALMVRDLHAKRKLMREMDRRSAAAADRRRQHNRTHDSLRARVTATSQHDRAHTPTYSQSQRQAPMQHRPMLGQTPNSTIVMVDERDEQRSEQEAADITRTMQPINTGELTTLQAITTNALNPLRAREHRAATVNYGSNEALAMQPHVVANLASSNVFSQTLQMPLTQYNTADMYNTAATNVDGQVPVAGQQHQRQQAMAASSSGSQQSRAAFAGPSGRVGRSQSLGVALFQRHRAASIAVEGSSTGPLAAARHRRASSERASHSSRQQTSTTGSGSQLHVTHDGLPAVINYSTPDTTQQSQRTASHLDLVHAPDMQRVDSESNNSHHTATATTTNGTQPQPQLATISLRPSTPSASSTSFTQSVSTSTPFPLSALELAALSSQLIFHRCGHEVKKLLDTNLYLSFIRQSVEFRKFRLQRRKEEREAALATRRQMVTTLERRPADSQGTGIEAVQILVIRNDGSDADVAAADPTPAS